MRRQDRETNKINKNIYIIYSRIFENCLNVFFIQNLTLTYFLHLSADFTLCDSFCNANFNEMRF